METMPPKKGKKGAKGKGGKDAKKDKKPAGLPEGFTTVADYIKKEVKIRFDQLCTAANTVAPAPFMKFLDTCIAEEKLFENVVAAEREFTGPAVRALAQTLLSWQTLKAFCVWRSSCGDEGTGRKGMVAAAASD